MAGPKLTDASDYVFGVGISCAMESTSVAFTCLTRTKADAVQSAGVFSGLRIFNILIWPDSTNTIQSLQVPSTLFYPLDPNAPVFWGHGAEQKKSEPGRRIEAFSILHDCEETEQENEKLRKLAFDLGKKNAFDFVTDYLRNLKDYITEYLKSKYGDYIFPELMDGAQVRYRISVDLPRLTPPELCNFKLLCIAAGFDQNHFSLDNKLDAILIALAGGNRIQNLTPSQVQILVHADSFAVDTASYVIKATKPSLVAHELCFSEGIKYPDKILDANFAKIVMSRLESSTGFTGTSMQEICDHIVKHFRECWLLLDYSGYDGSQSFKATNWLIRELEGVDFEDIHISSGEMRELVFDPFIALYQTLIEKELHIFKNFPDHKVNIAFYGSQSGNQYISGRLKNYFKLRWTFEIISAESDLKQSVVISRGLVWMGVDNGFKKRVSQWTIGVETERECEKCRGGGNGRGCVGCEHSGLYDFKPMTKVVEWVVTCINDTNIIKTDLDLDKILLTFLKSNYK